MANPIDRPTRQNTKKQPAPCEPIQWTRADPAALAAFNPKTKVCNMNCGQTIGDPRSKKEIKFLCEDCYEVPLMHHQTPTPVCPHCGHEFSTDDMEQENSADLFALAPQEETADIQCPICDQPFVVKGGYTPHYTTAFVEEEFNQ